MSDNNSAIASLLFFAEMLLFSAVTSAGFFWLYEAPREMYDYSASMFLIGLIFFGVCAYLSRGKMSANE
jgi:hypothetical protein